ncbi:AraC family transcriptional regulator [Acidovorax sp.]|uniref:AraC family transcriptional regulator n=1 Tax=Acidovorax sp. TaxID=1872122 RepID=UPI002608B4B3|nr:AraC family transcriptional regulator [Acidovorax sp.]
MGLQPSPPRFWRDPALPFVESRSAIDSRACYRPHTHATYSIGVVDAGTSVFASGGHSVRLMAGTLVAVPAGCVHACNPAPDGPWSYQMLHLDAAWLESTLAQANAPRSPSHALVLRAPSAYEAFCALNRQLFSDVPTADKEAALTKFLVQGAWRSGDVLALSPCTTSGRLARVQALLQARYAEPLPLSTLAQAANMAPHTLVRAFRAATGLTPHAYQLDLRINAARGLLRVGSAPAAVAHELGFYDQSHFQNAFKQRVAATPGDYRR